MNYDDKFKSSFTRNKIKVEQAIKQLSGKHAIDTSLAESFIESQISPLKRRAARDLIENTVYISLSEAADVVHALIHRLYTENDEEFSRENTKIYIVSGNIHKSSYFLSVLALKYIRDDKRKEPFRFIETLTEDILKEVGDNPILFIDDAAYSGSQLSKQLDNIYYNHVVVGNNPVPNIHVLLVALNTFSHAKLSKVVSKRLRKKIDMEFVPSPFKLLYLEKHLYTPLVLKLGIERFCHLAFFFSLFTMESHLPYISLYFDHKLADPVSTFTNTLMYGQIIPNNVRALKENEIEYISDLNSPDPAIEKKLLDDFNRTTGSKHISLKGAVFHIVQKINEEEAGKNDKPGVPYLQFKPFIKSCNTSPALLKLISDPEIINANYFLFMLPAGCLSGKPCGLGLSDESIKEIIFDTDSTDDLEKSQITKFHELNEKISSFRCPESWYKSGLLEMKNTNSKIKYSPLTTTTMKRTKRLTTSRNSTQSRAKSQRRKTFG